MAPGEVNIASKSMPGTGIPQLLVRAVLAGSPAKVWSVVDDCNGYRRSMPRVVASRELSRTPGTVQCEMTVDMPFPFQDMVSVSDSVLTLQPGRWHRTFRQLRGDYVKNDGYWLLTPCGADQTLVEYQVHAILGAAIPDVLVRRGQLTAMRDMMRRLGELSGPAEPR
ncbi:MAG: hypothetical protein HY902_00035 [Deltaproteobacteria bacterium]|nr:hypothetical protein [Deltaproteobacteria bacterium]